MDRNDREKSKNVSLNMKMGVDLHQTEPDTFVSCFFNNNDIFIYCLDALTIYLLLYTHTI